MGWEYVTDTQSNAHMPDLADIRTPLAFGDALTALRKSASLTVRELAEAAAIRPATLGGYMSGRHLPARPEALLPVLQALGVTDQDKLDEWAAALKRVRRVPGKTAAGPPPYRGLCSFQAEDAGWFFGRETLTTQLVERLAARLDGAGPLIAVGASGSGKSSLLRAGLLPALASGALPGSRAWPQLLLTPTSSPMKALASHLAPLVGKPEDDVRAELRADPVRCARLVEQVAARTDLTCRLDRDQAAADAGQPLPAPGECLPRRMVIVVDQFEELFTCTDDAERQAFITALCAAAGTSDGQASTAPALVVFGMRADFYAQALACSELVPHLQDAQVAVGPMSGPELRQAIEAPAAKAGLNLEPGLIELLLRDLASSSSAGTTGSTHEPGALPLLSHALLTTWHHRNRRTLTVAGYQAAGGIHGAVAHSAEQVHAGLTETQQLIARRVFLRLVHLGDGTPDTRRRVRRGEVIDSHTDAETAATVDVVNQFVAARLLTADTDTVEITHEALIRAWPRFREWISTDRAGLVVHRQLTAAASAWDADGRDANAVYRGGRLAAVRDWVATVNGDADLNPVERDFLEASLRDERRRARRGQRRAAVLAALLVVSLLASSAVFWQRGVAVEQRDAAEAQKRAAVARRLVVTSDTLLATDPRLSALLDVAAWRIDTSTVTADALVASQAHPLSVSLSDPTTFTGTVRIAFSPDGRLLAAAGENGEVLLWDVATRRLVSNPLKGARSAVLDMAFGPDGGTLTTVGANGAVQLWDVVHGRTRRMVHVGAQIGSAALSPDARTLVIATWDGTVRTWDLAKAHTRSEYLFRHSKGGGVGFAFTPDGKTLATAGSGERHVVLWDMHTGRSRRIAVHGIVDSLSSLAFSPSGQALAVEADQQVRLWELSTATSRKTLGGTELSLPGQTGSSTDHDLAFTPDGRTLAVAGSDGSVKLWDTVSGRHRGTTMTGHSGPVARVRFSPDGRLVATSGSDGAVRLGAVSMLPTGGRPFTGQFRPSGAAAFSPDGRVLATGSAAGLRLWDAATRKPHPSLTAGENDAVLDVAFSPDGRLASGHSDGKARVWKVTAGELVKTAETSNGGYVSTVGFVQAGRMLALSSLDPTRPNAGAHILSVWEPTSKRSHALSKRERVVRGPHFVTTPDGDTVAEVDDDAVRLLDPSTGKIKRETRLDAQGPVFAAAFSPDGRTLATTEKNNVKLRSSHGSAATTDRQAKLLAGHTDVVTSLVFSSNGSTLASASQDDTIRLWNPHTGELRGEPLATGHTTIPITDLAFSPDGQTLVSVDGEGGVIFWRLDPQEIAAGVCDFVRGQLSPEEWRRLIPELPYQRVCDSA